MCGWEEARQIRDARPRCRAWPEPEMRADAPGFQGQRQAGEQMAAGTGQDYRNPDIDNHGYSQDKPETRSLRCSPCSAGVQVIEPPDRPRSRHALQRRLVL
jgi:hypothetical protein